MDALLVRHEQVESELATGLTPDVYVRLSREFAELSPVVEAIKAYRSTEEEIAELAALIDDSATDSEMRKLADVERHQLQVRKEQLAQQIRLALLPRTRWTTITQSLKSVPVLAVTKPRYSPVIFSACTSGMLPSRAGRRKSSQ